jgi:hypothetical protein
VIARSTLRRPASVRADLDCAALTVGAHVLTATLVRRDGTRVVLKRTLTRSAGPVVDGADDEDAYERRR